MNWICCGCGKENDSGYTCVECGSRNTSDYVCSECGALNDPDDSCTGCGHALCDDCMVTGDDSLMGVRGYQFDDQSLKISPEEDNDPWY